MKNNLHQENFPIERKYKVFISSSFVDLREHRLSLLLKTLKMEHIPLGMELLKAGEPRNLDIIEKEIASSDIFVVLVGARPGSNVKGRNSLTYTMEEYELAKKHKLPVVPFLLNEYEYKKERDNVYKDLQKLKDVDKRKKQQRQIKEQRLRLDKFRNDVQQRKDGGKRIADFFSYSNIDELCGKYADAIHDEVKRLMEKHTGGWVMGNLYDELNARITLGISVVNPFFRRYADRLSTFKKLVKRTLVEKPSKVAIAEYFWGQYMPRLESNHTSHIYFESGSSIAYVSKKFIEYVKEEEWFVRHKLDTRLKLRTNNLFTYMDFLLIEPPWAPMDIQLMPHGFFSEDYGATYGELKSAVRLPPPPKKPTIEYKLANDAAREVSKLTSKLASAFTRKAGIVLMTASGVDINPASPFPGPHVGSYYNMLVKRCLFSLPCPKVLFLDQEKWGYDFDFDRCHPVCDIEFMWRNLKTESPVAIAIAAKGKDSLDKLCKSLAKNGFRHQERGEAKPQTPSLWPVIAANDLFAEHFKLQR